MAPPAFLAKSIFFPWEPLGSSTPTACPLSLAAPAGHSQEGRCVGCSFAPPPSQHRLVLLGWPWAFAGVSSRQAARAGGGASPLTWVVEPQAWPREGGGHCQAPRGRRAGGWVVKGFALVL